ncbi:hypothetical protein Tco_0619365 [Tanacetum coccineum]
MNTLWLDGVDEKSRRSFHETAREDSPVEVATSPPKTKSKPTRGHQKRTIQSDDAPRQIAWINQEEIALCKGWVYIFENSRVGNTRKDVGFWCEVLQYMESNSKQYDRRTLQESGASDEDYYARALVNYEAKTRTTFKLLHCREILKGSPKWMQSEVPKFVAKSGEGSKRYMTSRSSSFNTESGKGSINLNADVGDDKEDEVQEIR